MRVLCNKQKCFNIIIPNFTFGYRYVMCRYVIFCHDDTNSWNEFLSKTNILLKRIQIKIDMFHVNWDFPKIYFDDIDLSVLLCVSYYRITMFNVENSYVYFDFTSFVEYWYNSRICVYVWFIPQAWLYYQWNRKF